MPTRGASTRSGPYRRGTSSRRRTRSWRWRSCSGTAGASRTTPTARRTSWPASSLPTSRPTPGWTRTPSTPAGSRRTCRSWAGTWTATLGRSRATSAAPAPRSRSSGRTSTPPTRTCSAWPRASRTPAARSSVTRRPGAAAPGRAGCRARPVARPGHWRCEGPQRAGPCAASTLHFGGGRTTPLSPPTTPLARNPRMGRCTRCPRHGSADEGSLARRLRCRAPGLGKTPGFFSRHFAPDPRVQGLE
mmetsp:Transcript_33389/g.95656  ORF Transcript_33389/g.95656 Transcript_33389/m.95656 type:complete len:246 (-) Transcript_33389:320-1057(-)